MAFPKKRGERRIAIGADAAPYHHSPLAICSSLFFLQSFDDRHVGHAAAFAHGLETVALAALV
jgi:hypothetical protein